MSAYRFTIHVTLPPESAYALWISLEALVLGTGAPTNMTDVVGDPGRAGTTYTVLFGRLRVPTEVLQGGYPHEYRVRHGGTLLRGESVVAFEPEFEGTRLTHEFRPAGLVAHVAALVFATGWYRGSFRGEL